MHLLPAAEQQSAGSDEQLRMSLAGVVEHGRARAYRADELVGAEGLLRRKPRDQTAGSLEQPATPARSMRPAIKVTMQREIRSGA